MERHLIERLTGTLIDGTFQSKREMAEKVGIPYRAFLAANSGRSSSQSTEKIIGAILRYCIREHIPLDDVFPPKMA